jgi:hypothetical protein
LSGGTLRIPNSFLTQVAGGRNVVYSTSLLLALPMLIASIALRDPRCPFNLLIACALLSGAGGGAFASSSKNHSTLLHWLPDLSFLTRHLASRPSSEQHFILLPQETSRLFPGYEWWAWESWCQHHAVGRSNFHDHFFRCRPCQSSRSSRLAS